MKKRILVIDDNPADQRLVEEMITEAGINCTFFFSLTGEDALRDINKHRPHLIILDMTLPDADGTVICATIKASNQWQNIPIITYTGAREETNRDASRLVQANAHFVKNDKNWLFVQEVKKLLKVE